mmetsp:Transcript_5801/g.10280  ORF Transcript_5801/g.10280 Transcript_5801/m.10280 type:complete len:83 (+) Transcript_5801:239-487(+)
MEPKRLHVLARDVMVPHALHKNNPRSSYEDKSRERSLWKSSRTEAAHSQTLTMLLLPLGSQEPIRKISRHFQLSTGVLHSRP